MLGPRSYVRLSPAQTNIGHGCYLVIALFDINIHRLLCFGRPHSEVSSSQFLSLSTSNLSTEVLPKASHMASLASQTWTTLAVSMAFEASEPQTMYWSRTRWELRLTRLGGPLGSFLIWRPWLAPAQNAIPQAKAFEAAGTPRGD